jgi:hypothetical protein
MKIEKPARVFYWAATGMVRYRESPDPQGVAYLEKEEVERLLQEVYQQGYQAGAEAAAMVVRQTPVRPG